MKHYTGKFYSGRKYTVKYCGIPTDAIFSHKTPDGLNFNVLSPIDGRWRNTFLLYSDVICKQ